MTFADVKNDIAFRKIFGNSRKSITLISFLNAVLELEGDYRIRSLTFLNPYMLPRLSEEKSSIIDVRAIDKRGNRFVVEMQVASKKGFKQRVQYYAARDFSMQIDTGEDYPKLKPTYFIGIVNFRISKGKHYVSKHLTIDVETGENILDHIKYTFIQLTKFQKKEHELVTATDKWTYFIKNAKDLKIIPDYVDDKGLRIAFEEANKHNWDKEELIAYDNIKVRETDVKMEREFAVEEGKAEGKAQAELEKEELILNFHKIGISVANIAIATQKTEDEVQQIIVKYKE